MLSKHTWKIPRNVPSVGVAHVLHQPGDLLVWLAVSVLQLPGKTIETNPFKFCRINICVGEIFLAAMWVTLGEGHITTKVVNNLLTR